MIKDSGKLVHEPYSFHDSVQDWYYGEMWLGSYPVLIGTRMTGEVSLKRYLRVWILNHCHQEQ